MTCAQSRMSCATSMRTRTRCRLACRGSDCRLDADQARDWLDAYFAPQPKGATALPASLTDWTRARHQSWRIGGHPGCPAAFTIQGNHGRLTIRWVPQSPEHGGYLILSEERLGHASRDLMSLGLTPREADVLHWLGEGKSNDSIAIILGIASRTVEKHVETFSPNWVSKTASRPPYVPANSARNLEWDWFHSTAATGTNSSRCHKPLTRGRNSRKSGRNVLPWRPTRSPREMTRRSFTSATK
jgi:DNA-binding CsgD family transcriptional regulator